jgi:hypothetical protein
VIQNLVEYLKKYFVLVYWFNITYTSNVPDLQRGTQVCTKATTELQRIWSSTESSVASRAANANAKSACSARACTLLFH